MNITLDRQVVSKQCEDCGAVFTVVRGSFYGDGNPLGLYLVAFHGHTEAGPIAHLALAVQDKARRGRSSAVVLDATALTDQFTFSFVDWVQSPWKDEAYLGEMLDRDMALNSPYRGLFLHVAEHIIQDLPEAREYFNEQNAR